MKHRVSKFVMLLLVLVLATGALGVVSAQDGDTVTILFWQAASTVNSYLSGGTKDIEAAALVLEPLARMIQMVS